MNVKPYGHLVHPLPSFDATFIEHIHFFTHLSAQYNLYTTLYHECTPKHYALAIRHLSTIWMKVLNQCQKTQ